MLETPARPSDTVKEKILSQLHRDARVDATDISVEMRDDTVILTGSVPSLSARRAAEADASIIPGVRLVDNRLSIAHRRARAPADRELRSRIRDLLRWNSSLDFTKIGVGVSGGIVRLEGAVPSLWQKFKAQDIAENVAGVVEVDNALSVAPVGKFADAAITEEVALALIRDLRLDPDSFEVLVENGIVTLFGNVPDISTFRGVESITSCIAGVVAVKNNMIIEPTRDDTRT